MYLEYKPLAEITGAFPDEGFSESALRRHAQTSGLFERRRVSLEEVLDVALHKLLERLEEGESGDKISAELLKLALKVYMEEGRGCGIPVDEA